MLVVTENNPVVNLNSPETTNKQCSLLFLLLTWNHCCESDSDRLPSAPIFPIFSYIFRASYFFQYFDPKSYIFPSNMSNSYIFQNAADNNEISRKNHGILV